MDNNFKTVKDLFMFIKNHETLYTGFETIFTLNDTNDYRCPKEVTERLRYIEASRQYLKRAFEIIEKTDPVLSEDRVFVFKYIEDDILRPFDETTSYWSELMHDKTLRSVDKETFTVSNIGDSENNVAGYGYEFCELNEILGYRIANSCVAEYNIIQCALSIFEEMFFNGIESEDRDERVKSLDDSIAELDEINKLPEEEREKHLVSWDELRNELRRTRYDGMSADQTTFEKLRDEMEEQFDENPEIKEIVKRRNIDLMTRNDAERKRMIRKEFELM